MATARTWVNLRADARRESEIVGVISPGTRVELAESRGGWRWVLTSTMSGWAAPRLFAVDSSRRR
jgi:SH3-like domain-containing protein